MVRRLVIKVICDIFYSILIYLILFIINIMQWYFKPFLLTSCSSVIYQIIDFVSSSTVFVPNNVWLHCWQLLSVNHVLDLHLYHVLGIVPMSFSNVVIAYVHSTLVFFPWLIATDIFDFRTPVCCSTHSLVFLATHDTLIICLNPFISYVNYCLHYVKQTFYIDAGK